MTNTRRAFIRSVAAYSAMTAPAFSYGRILGSNDQIRVAVIGINGRGNAHMGQFHKNLVAVCDCDSEVLGRRSVEFETRYGRKLSREGDFRYLIERNDIDAVSIATPNHLHSLIGVASAEAGKDVYCEKPVSHNVWEGRQLVNAARKYNRIIQCGTQIRSSAGIADAVRFVRSGQLGKTLYAISTCYKPRKSIGKLDRPLRIPQSVDFELWCGPAAKKDIFRPRLHYDWHWDFNTGNGDVGNQGIHQMDIARWFLGETRISPRVISIGGRFGYDDAGNTPNTQIVLLDYPTAPLIFETRGLPKASEFHNQGWGSNMDQYRGTRVGVVVQCENGYVTIPSYSNATAFDNDGIKIRSWTGGGNHFENFLDAVRNRAPRLLNAEILQGHISSALCHTCGLSHQLGIKASVDEVKQMVGNRKLFAESLARMVSHLEANHIDLNKTPLVLGVELHIDPITEQCIDNDRANVLMSREYRPGFVVPDLS